MKKRETERQAELRLSSYAHLEARERQEAWRALEAHQPGSGAAEQAWAALERCACSFTAVPMRSPTID